MSARTKPDLSQPTSFPGKRPLRVGFGDLGQVAGSGHGGDVL